MMFRGDDFAMTNDKQIRLGVKFTVAVVLVIALVAGIIGYTPFIGFWIALSVVGFSSVCIVMGMIYSLRGIARDLPIIGGIRFIR